MNLRLGCVTDTGNCRSKNQDRIMCDSKQIGNEMLAITCVCDGIGSFKDSEIAAEMFTNGIKNWFQGIVKYYPQVMGKDAVLEDLEETIRELNELICEYREEKHNDIGCTMSLMFVINSEYFIFHVGDSRIYCVRDALLQLTTDEVVVKQVNGKEKKLLANYVGKNMALALSKKYGIRNEKDVFISGSDGLYKRLRYEDVSGLSERVLNNEMAEEACRGLIQLVLERGESDNVSCSIMCF